MEIFFIIDLERLMIFYFYFLVDNFKFKYGKFYMSLFWMIIKYIILFCRYGREYIFFLLFIV